MAIRNKALQSYGSVKVASGVASSDNVQLVQMLLDGLIENLVTAEGQIQRKEIEKKSKTLSRAANIVMGLQTALDHKKGGELAQNLNELSTYVTRRFFTVNTINDIKMLREVISLMENIRDAWKQVPGLIPKTEDNDNDNRINVA